MKIAIDGMDGVGKSTVAKILGERINYPVYEQKLVEKIGMDPIFYKKLVKYIESSNNKNITSIFYILKSLLDNEEENVIAVRSIVSLYYFEHNNLDPKLIESILELGIIPDLIVILYAGVEERIKRIKKRNENDPDLVSKEALSEGYDIMLDFVKQYNLPYLGIDTTNINIDKVVLLLEKIIEGYERSSNKIDYIKNINEVYGFENIYEKGEKHEKVLKRR